MNSVAGVASFVPRWHSSSQWLSRLGTVRYYESDKNGRFVCSESVRWIANVPSRIAREPYNTSQRRFYLNSTKRMPYQLMTLPYAQNALEPHISKETIEFHHGKHHQAYVNKLNDLRKDKPMVDLVELLKTLPDGVEVNQVGQIWNHDFYWHSLAPKAGGAPTGKVAELIKRDFGSFENFKEKFSAVAAGHFGSGWAWLNYNPTEKKLTIEQSHDASNPLRENKGTPILACDVWEHAYYIDHRNNRAAYIAAWWNLINWKFANENLEKCML